MKTLHWHTDDNPCELCGVPVTPESWLWPRTSTAKQFHGGLVCDGDGAWWMAQFLDGPGIVLSEILDPGVKQGFAPGEHWAEVSALAPIFPPKGWAGKTDVELWTEVFGHAWKGPEFVVGNWKWACRVNWGSPPELCLAACTPIYADDFTPASSAIANAQVLATRLKEARHGTR